MSMLSAGSLFSRNMATRFGRPTSIRDDVVVPANALTSKAGDVLTDKSGFNFLTAKAA